jgi:hypothetical protein
MSPVDAAYLDRTSPEQHWAPSIPHRSLVKYGEKSCAHVKAYVDAVPESAAPPVIEKYTGVMAAADVYTAHTALWILESIGLDRGVGINVRL